MGKDTLRTFPYAYGHTSKKPGLNKHSIINTNICFSRGSQINMERENMAYFLEKTQSRENN